MTGLIAQPAVPMTLEPTGCDSAASSEIANRESLLIQHSRNGDGNAFNEIIRIHTPRIYNYIYQMTRQRQDAEDLAQVTFIKAFHNLHRFDDSRPIIAWLLTIARRSALNHFRSSKKWETLSELAVSNEPSPARTAEQNEAKNSLWADARRLLSEREFEILWLRFGEDLSIEDTARIVGLTQTHVKVIVFRAKKHLMKLRKL